MDLPANSFWLSDGLAPHGFCIAWQPSLLALHVVSDTLIALSYYSIPLALVWLVVRRRDLSFGWALMLFATFILACGTTHLMDIWTLWHADYALQGVIKAITAVASVLTAILLWPLVPRLLEAPSPAVLAEANARLADQIREKQAALDALRVEILERERAEAMLRHSHKMQAIGELTGGIAHDFNNLLMIVQGNLEVLQRRLFDDAALSRYIERSTKAIERGAVLTRQLLAFARRQPLQPSAVNVNALVTGLSELLPRTVGERVRLVFELQPDLWEAEADPGQLDSALLNLALNAGHAMPSGGELVVRTANLAMSSRHSIRQDLDVEEVEPGDYVLVSVADSGGGMTPDVREKAFEPFFTTKPAGIGHGLGLSQVYGFIRQSRGRVSLQSEVGQGTTVTLLLRRAVSVDVLAEAPLEAQTASG